RHNPPCRWPVTGPDNTSGDLLLRATHCSSRRRSPMKRHLDPSSSPAPISPFDDKRSCCDENERRYGRMLLLKGVDTENGEHCETCEERQPYDRGTSSGLL